MAKTKTKTKSKDVQALIDLTKSTQTLLTHYQSSLAPSQKTPSESQTTKADLPNPLDVIKASTTLLRSHTTTLSLLLITPPLTASAIITKINDVSSGPISGMVATALYVPRDDQPDHLGNIMRVEVKSQVRRLLGTWGDVLALILNMAERKQSSGDAALTESEKQDVLSATGVVWATCDTLLQLCSHGTVGLVVKKAGELRAVLLDAIEELKEWGDDVEDEDDEAAAHSDDEDEDEDEDEDDMFGSSNKLGKDDKELKQLLDTSVKKLKMIAILYQALIKRRLKTYSASPATFNPSKKLDELMDRLKSIPETVDDMASAFYDLDEEEAKRILDKCSTEATQAIEAVKHNWDGTEDQFTSWSANWIGMFNEA